MSNKPQVGPNPQIETTPVAPAITPVDFEAQQTSIQAEAAEDKALEAKAREGDAAKAAKLSEILRAIAQGKDNVLDAINAIDEYYLLAGKSQLPKYLQQKRRDLVKQLQEEMTSLGLPKTATEAEYKAAKLKNMAGPEL